MRVGAKGRGARAARIVHVASLVILAVVAIGAIGGELARGQRDESFSFFFLTLTAVLIGGYTTLGRLIVTRAGNVIGWTFLAMGGAAALSLPAEAYVAVSYEQPYVAGLPGTEVAGWLINLLPACVALAIPMLFLLFPTGAPPTPRWRWVSRLWLAGTALSLVWLTFRPGAIYGEPGRFSIQNPFGLRLLEPLSWLFFDVGTGCVLVAAAASIVSLVIRFRRARGVERQQVKWLMLVGVAAVAILLGMFAISAIVGETDGGVSDLLWLALVIVLIVGIPTATGLAIFRHRLYDVDVVISKTIVYAALALFIGAVYVGLVVGVGALIGSGTESLALRIAATAVIAVAFQPVRARLQRFANRLVYGERSTPYEVMSEFGHRMAGVPSVDQVLPDMAEAAARGVGATRARVRLFLMEGRERSVAWPEDGDLGEPTLTIPVTHAGDRVGELAVVKPPNEPLRPAERSLLEDLAGHAGLALHNVRLTADLQAKADELAASAEELRRSRERLVTARDSQRRRLEQELRSGVGAELAGIRDEIQAEAEQVAADPTTVQSSLDGLGERANTALEALRDVARGVFPPLLVDQGLGAALEAHLRKLALGATLRFAPEIAGRRFDPDVEAAVYFCCVQALQNVQRNSKGTEVNVSVEPDGADALRFVVHDGGAGFDPAALEQREGMQIMTDRIAALGGTLAVQSAPGRGTTVTGRVPMLIAEEAVAR